MREHRWGIPLVLLALVLAGCQEPASSPAGASAPASATASASATPSRGGPARIVATKDLSSRSLDLTVESPAVGGPVQVRLLLPPRFRTQPSTLR